MWAILVFTQLNLLLGETSGHGPLVRPSQNQRPNTHARWGAGTRERYHFPWCCVHALPRGRRMAEGGGGGGEEKEEVRGVFIEQSWREAKIKEDVDMWQNPGSACFDLMEILYKEQVARAYTCMHVTKKILLIGNPKRRRKLPKKKTRKTMCIHFQQQHSCSCSISLCYRSTCLQGTHGEAMYMLIHSFLMKSTTKRGWFLTWYARLPHKSTLFMMSQTQNSVNSTKWQLGLTVGF